DNLDFTPNYEKELKITVQKQLVILIDKVNERIEAKNNKTIKGKIKQSLMDFLVDMEDIKKGVPQYADAMIKQIKKPTTQGKLKDLLKDKIANYLAGTFDMQDMSEITRILNKVGAKDIDEAREKLEKEILTRHERISNYAMALIILAIIVFLIPIFDKKNLPVPVYTALAMGLVILLITGVTTPMIDMEAKISQMSFILLNHSVKFENQVLYFQSKSVLDVFWIMITNDTLQMKAVGILMVLFSIVFPICKLSSSVAYYFNYKNSQENGWIKWFVLKSGKWSMADVLVVAIFMAFIGFNGIISSQLGKLNSSVSKEVVIFTTNGTNLQPGFYVFFTYAMLALFLSNYLERKLHKPSNLKS
ncbi:MAG: paraquat-inducible protein A, partial [Bdellovibrionales bacterium]|nr:paraquat-inducible protein A [Bdellovibrionales bacterium]